MLHRLSSNSALVMLAAISMAACLSEAAAQSVHPTAVARSASASRASYAVATPGQHAAAVHGTLAVDVSRQVDGVLFIAEHWMVFRPSDGSDVIHVPMVIIYRDGRPAEWTLRTAPHRDRDESDVTVFTISSWGSFETREPAALDRMLRERSAGEVLSASRAAPLANSAARAAELVSALAASPFADTLYALAGRPRAMLGVLSAAHRASGNGAVYVPGADSVAIDPLSARSTEDLRGMLAHELGHRLQRLRPGLLDAVWSGVPPVRDPAVYGYRNRAEHQAEAFRFAVTYLQTTSAEDRDRLADVRLLELYEALMPGTRAVTKVLLDEPVYAAHPLASALRGRATEQTAGR